MQTFKFGMSIGNVELTDEIEFYSHDATPELFWATIDEQPHVTLFVEAVDVYSAFAVATDRVQEVAPNAFIGRIDRDLVSISDIADRTDVSRETVRKWSRGERQEGFPTPLDTVGQGRKVAVWDWYDVNKWLARLGLADDFVTPSIGMVTQLEHSALTHRIFIAGAYSYSSSLVDPVDVDFMGPMVLGAGQVSSAKRMTLKVARVSSTKSAKFDVSTHDKIADMSSDRGWSSSKPGSKDWHELGSRGYLGA